MALDDLQDVFVLQHMGEAHTLGIVLGAGALQWRSDDSK